MQGYSGYSQDKYNDFLFKSELFEALASDYLKREPLARALLSVLVRKKLLTQEEVFSTFEQLLRYHLTEKAEYLDRTDDEGMENSPLQDFLDDMLDDFIPDKEPIAPPAPLQFPCQTEDE